MDEHGIIVHTKTIEIATATIVKTEFITDPAFDAAAITVPAQRMNAFLEQFQINVEVESDPLRLTLAWDSVMVAVPIEY